MYFTLTFLNCILPGIFIKLSQIDQSVGKNKRVEQNDLIKHPEVIAQLNKPKSLQVFHSEAVKSVERKNFKKKLFIF